MKDSFAHSAPKFIQSQATLDLIDILSPYVTYEKIPANRRLYYCLDGVHMCYLIRSGLIKIRRNSDDFVIAFLPVPNLVGVTNLLPESSGLYLELQTESEIATITTAHAHELIANNNAWELLAGHIAKVSSNLLNHEIIMTAPTSYELLRFQLIGLMKEPVNVRKSTSAAKYILERTRLSRSTVMKMLAQLKQGGYIELVDGMLLAVHQLPSKY